jgi:hypothetical protein
LRNLSDVLITKLLPAEDFSCDVLRYIVREIVTNIIFKFILTLISKPEWIYQSIISSCTIPPPEEKGDGLMHLGPDTPLDASIPLQSIFKQEHKTFVMRNRKSTSFSTARPRSNSTVKPLSTSLSSDGFYASLQTFWAWVSAPQTSIESRYRDTYLDESLFSLARELLDGNYWVSHLPLNSGIHPSLVLLSPNLPRPLRLTHQPRDHLQRLWDRP